MIWCECLPYSQKLKKRKGLSDLPGAKLLIERNVKVRASLTASTCQTTDSYHTGVSLIAVCSRLCPFSVRGATEMYKSRKWAGESWGLLHANHWLCLSGDSPATDLPVPVRRSRLVHSDLFICFYYRYFLLPNYADETTKTENDCILYELFCIWRKPSWT